MKKILIFLCAALFANCGSPQSSQKLRVNNVICTSAHIPHVISDDNLNERMLSITYNSNGKVIYVEGEDIRRYEFDYVLPEKIIIDNYYCVITDYAGNAARVYQMDKQGQLEVDSHGWTFDMRYIYDAGYLVEVELNKARGGMNRLKYNWDKGNLKQVVETKSYNGDIENHTYDFTYSKKPIIQNTNYFDWIYYCDNAWEINYILSIAGLLGKQSINLPNEFYRDAQKEMQSTYSLNKNGSLKEQVLVFPQRGETWKLNYSYAQF